jgi:hypothetical protein
LGNDDLGLHGRWLHGLSPQGALVFPDRLILSQLFEKKAAPKGGFLLV